MPELTKVFQDAEIYSGRDVLGKTLQVEDLAVVTRMGDEPDLTVLQVKDYKGGFVLVYSGSILLRRYAETIRMLCPCWVRFTLKGEFYALEVFTKGEPSDAKEGIQEPPPRVEEEAGVGSDARGSNGGVLGADGKGVLQAAP